MPIVSLVCDGPQRSSELGNAEARNIRIWCLIAGTVGQCLNELWPSGQPIIWFWWLESHNGEAVVRRMHYLSCCKALAWKEPRSLRGQCRSVEPTSNWKTWRKRSQHLSLCLTGCSLTTCENVIIYDSESATNGPNQRPGISDHESATNFIESATVFTGWATKPANQRPSVRIRHHELATKSVDLAAAFCQISHTTSLYSDQLYESDARFNLRPAACTTENVCNVM